MRRDDRVRHLTTGWTGTVVAIVPVFDDTGQPVTSEVLVRWDHSVNQIQHVSTSDVEQVPISTSR
jgi:hypothetical protein